MDDADLTTTLLGIIGLLESYDQLQDDMLELARTDRRRVAALAETVDDVHAEVIELRRTANFLLNMKAATLTMTCAKCGAVYAKEPGPELCGPCWIAAGRPGSIGLHAV